MKQHTKSNKEHALAVAFSPVSEVELGFIPKHLSSFYRHILQECLNKPLCEREPFLLKMLGFSPNNPLILLRLAFFYGVTGQNDKAQGSLNRALPLLKLSKISFTRIESTLTAGL